MGQLSKDTKLLAATESYASVLVALYSDLRGLPQYP
jgi:hypothetical protein